jgi:pyruvate carboxylase subunit B
VKYHVTVNGRSHEVEIDDRPGNLKVRVDGRPVALAYHEVEGTSQVVVSQDGRSFGIALEGDARRVGATIAGHFYEVQLEDERERAARAADRGRPRQGGVVASIMPGVVVELLVERGQAVEKGQPLLILSAMKMQNEIAAPAAGVVAQVHVSPGQAVSAGTKLVTLTVS